jgi:hypothetical protein
VRFPLVHLVSTANPLPVDEPGSGKEVPYYVKFNGSKAEAVLGLHYRTMEVTVRVTCASGSLVPRDGEGVLRLHKN